MERRGRWGDRRDEGITDEVGCDTCTIMKSEEIKGFVRGASEIMGQESSRGAGTTSKGHMVIVSADGDDG